MYKFSSEPVAEFYGRKFYSISNNLGDVVAYSERVFEIPETVRFLGESRCLIFERAEIMGGTFRGGDFRGGTFRGGTFRGGDFRGGDFWGGDFRGGDFRGGTFRGGTFQGGDFWGGDFRGGTFRGGTFRGDTFRGGTFRGGDFRGGTFWGGDFWGGTFQGGTFRGGTFRGGDFRGGVYEVSMLQIQGTRHFLYAYFNEDNAVELGIGCERHSIAWWQENYEKIGEEEYYTEEEIAEYKAYIDLYALRYIK